MNEYHVVSFSGGKDSTAMLLHMIELKMPIDDIIFCDTGVEFPEMYEHIEKVEKYIGRKITRLQAEHDFEYFLLEYRPKSRRTKNEKYHSVGLSFPSSHIRWCTRRLKADIADKHIKGLSFPDAKIRWCTAYLKRDAVKKMMRGFSKQVNQYIGIASDEPKRIKDKKYPLVDWGWTEADCLEYCKEKGFDWGGLVRHI